MREQEMDVHLWMEVDSDGEWVPHIRTEEDLPDHLGQLMFGFLGLLYLVIESTPEPPPTVIFRVCGLNGRHFYTDGTPLPCPHCGQRMRRF